MGAAELDAPAANTVDPEQQALNEAANKRHSKDEDITQSNNQEVAQEDLPDKSPE